MKAKNGVYEGRLILSWKIMVCMLSFSYTFNKEKQPPKATSIKGNPDWVY